MDDVGWSVTEMATRLACEGGTLSHLLNGKAGVSVNMVLALEDIGWGTADHRMRMQGTTNSHRRGATGRLRNVAWGRGTHDRGSHCRCCRLGLMCLSWNKVRACAATFVDWWEKVIRLCPAPAQPTVFRWRLAPCPSGQAANDALRPMPGPPEGGANQVAVPIRLCRFSVPACPDTESPSLP